MSKTVLTADLPLEISSVTQIFLRHYLSVSLEPSILYFCKFFFSTQKGIFIQGGFYINCVPVVPPLLIFLSLCPSECQCFVKKVMVEKKKSDD